MASISVDGLRKQYPLDSRYCGVEDVSFTVEDGEYFSLVGPSGSGKTTTLRLIAGIDEPDDGAVAFDGEPMATVPPNERHVSFVFENLALYPDKTGRENIVHPLVVEDIPEDERAERVDEIADRLGISHLLDRLPETFSGGEKQRVGIARALVSDSSVYLLDDPLGGLDAKLRQELRVLLKEIHQDLGGTFIHVTHSQAEAMSVAERMAVMREGRVSQIGTPTGLYDEPKNEFVASFIGSPTINLFDGALADGQLTAGPFTFETQSIGSDLDEGDYRVGVRPQDAQLSQANDDDGYSAKVEVTEPLGAESIVDLAIDGQELRVVSDERWVQRDLGIGDSVGLSIAVDDLYLIAADSGDVVRVPTRTG
jgi:ABC-type sugar transport system ATPase subunit